MTEKFMVLTDVTGTVVGTMVGDGTRDPNTGFAAGLTARPGQTLQIVEFEMPALKDRADVDEFHRKLTEHLRK